jgi:hypothetical protein
MPPFGTTDWNEIPYMHGYLTMNASDLVEILSPPKGNDLYANLAYDKEKMQYVKPGEVCDFGVKKGDNNMTKYEFMHDGFVATATPNTAEYIDTDDIGKLIAERDKARLDYVDVLRREHENEQKTKKAQTIKKVIFNPPATIVFWADGTKTVVKCQDDEAFFDPEKGLAMAFMKKMLGNKGNYYNTVDKWVHPYWQKEFDETCDWQTKFDEAAKALSAAFSDNKKGDEQS